MKPLTFVSLFAGIGGIDLGFERAGMRCVAQVEIDPFCREVLAKKFPHARRFEDVRRFGRRSIRGAVDVVCGGFPCQDISVAGRGVGLGGSRSGLWWEMLRIVRAFRPAWVFIENVPALRSRGADDVISALEAEGYTAWPVVVGAEHVGAPHRRERVWIVGYSGRTAGKRNAGRFPAAKARERGARSSNGNHPQRSEYASAGCWWGTVAYAECGVVADASGERFEERHAPARSRRPGLDSRPPAEGGSIWPAGPSEAQYPWEAPRLIELADAERDRRQGEGERPKARYAQRSEQLPRRKAGRESEWSLGSSAHGLSRRLVRLKRRHNRDTLRAAGNSVVPIIPEIIGRWIVQQHEGRAA